MTPPGSVRLSVKPWAFPLPHAKAGHVLLEVIGPNYAADTRGRVTTETIAVHSKHLSFHGGRTNWTMAWMHERGFRPKRQRQRRNRRNLQQLARSRCTFFHGYAACSDAKNCSAEKSGHKVSSEETSRTQRRSCFSPVHSLPLPPPPPPKIPAASA